MPDDTSRRPWLPRWMVARWLRATPGPYGLAAIAAFPALFFLPFEATGLFSNWSDGASRLHGLSLPLLALTLLRDIGARTPEDFWLHQKGASLAEWAWLRLGAELLFGLAVVTWWTAVFTMALSAHGIPVSLDLLLTLILGSWLTYAVVGVLCLVLGATGYPRAVDLALIILIVTLIVPVFDRLIAPALATLLRTLLPPVLPVGVLHRALAQGLPWRDVVHPLLHIVAWCTVVLGLATWMLERRVPPHGPPQ